MKLYAVVIGKKGKHTRYVTCCPFTNDENAIASEKALAVYTAMKRARIARKKILARCGHKNVHVIPFTAGRE